MNKKFKLVSILSLALCGLVIAWNTLVVFFSGVGVNFVAVLALFGVVFIVSIEDSNLFYKTKDLFYADLIIAGFETLMYVMLEFFGRFGNIFRIFSIVQTVFSAFAILYFAYVILKILYAIQERAGGVFYCLFHPHAYSKTKHKTNKELANGSLSDKPFAGFDDDKAVEGQVETDDEFDEL